MTRIDLTRSPTLSRLLVSRYPQLAVVGLALAGYLFAILAGAIGTPVGSGNFSIVFVWIAWWALLILFAVPFLGRAWCSVCPIPAPGEWIQRRAVLGPAPASRNWKGLRWPLPLRNIWLQSVAFLLLALFSTVLLTTPLVTALVLAAMLLMALVLSLVFERRTFCRYLCPVSGFIGLYSQTAPIELRIKDKSICVSCVGKPCYNGSARGYGCPWDVFPGGLTRNTSCGLCLECLRTCPSDNISVNLRNFSADLQQPSAKLDEAFKSFVMLGAAAVYAAVLLGPWSSLKAAAFEVGTPSWFLSATGLLVLVCLVLPGLFALCSFPGADIPNFRRRFARMSTALIPLGLMAWIAFSLSFVLSNASYIAASASDPLGIGWNLLGTAGLAWQPMLTAGVAPSQTLVLVVGLVWSARVAQNAAAQLRISPLPAILYAAAFSALMMWLLL